MGDTRVSHPLGKGDILLGLGATKSPVSNPVVTPKVTAISLTPWGVRSSRFLLLKGTTSVGTGTSGQGLAIAIRVGGFGRIGVLSTLDDPVAPGRRGVGGSQGTQGLRGDRTRGACTHIGCSIPFCL